MPLGLPVSSVVSHEIPPMNSFPWSESISNNPSAGTLFHYGSLVLQQTATTHQAQAHLRHHSVSLETTVYRDKMAAKEATREETKQRHLIWKEALLGFLGFFVRGFLKKKKKVMGFGDWVEWSLTFFIFVMWTSMLLWNYWYCYRLKIISLSHLIGVLFLHFVLLKFISNEKP